MAGRLPTRGRHAIVQQLADRPNVVRDVCRYRWGLPSTIRQGQTAMYCAEVVDCSSQVHPLVERCQTAGRASAPAAQARQPLSERRVQALDVRRVQHLTARRAPQQRQKQACAAVNETMDGSTHCPRAILLHYLTTSSITNNRIEVEISSKLSFSSSIAPQFVRWFLVRIRSD
jgi:ribosomal protein L31